MKLKLIHRFFSLSVTPGNRITGPIATFLPLGVLILFLLGLAGCREDEAGTPKEAPDAGQVKLATSPTLGTYLTDGLGNTLYLFTRDASGTSNCSGNCATIWPVYYAENVSAGSGLEGIDFGTITLPDGSRQTTYKGWPLYYYAPGGVREEAGETRGEGASNNAWFVAKPDYTLLLAGQTIPNNATGQPESKRYLVDEKGFTLYYFERDTVANQSQCTGGCISAWPLYYREAIKGPSALSAADFSSITRPDGMRQTTYKGRPLYYFAPPDGQSGRQRELRGETKGHGTIGAGGLWFVLDPALQGLTM